MKANISFSNNNERNILPINSSFLSDKINETVLPEEKPNKPERRNLARAGREALLKNPEFWQRKGEERKNYLNMLHSRLHIKDVMRDPINEIPKNIIPSNFPYSITKK